MEAESQSNLTGKIARRRVNRENDAGGRGRSDANAARSNEVASIRENRRRTTNQRDRDLQVNGDRTFFLFSSWSPGNQEATETKSRDKEMRRGSSSSSERIVGRAAGPVKTNEISGEELASLESKAAQPQIHVKLEASKKVRPSRLYY